MTYASTAEWFTSIAPLMVPLIASWFEQRGMRRELSGLRMELRTMERDHLTRLVDLEIRVSKAETSISQVIAA